MPDEAAFRTPSLRNVELSAPYMHNGQARTLAAAIWAHDKAVPALTPDDVAAIGTFLNSLTDQAFINDPNLALPRSICGQTLRRQQAACLSARRLGLLTA